MHLFHLLDESDEQDTYFSNHDIHHGSSIEELNNLFSDNVVFLVVYSPGCGHCKSLAPEWIKMENYLHKKGSKCNIAKIHNNKLDILNNLRPAHSRIHVNGVPHIIKIKNNKHFDYDREDRTSDNLIKWVEEDEHDDNGSPIKYFGGKKKRKSLKKKRKSKRRKSMKKKTKRKSRKSKKH
jgi:thiol-disulfide isomerase/thioredoxin